MDIIIVTVATVLLAVGVAAKIGIRARNEYRCHYCNGIFRPRMNNWMRLLLNFPQGGCALKCPHCKEKSIMKKTEDSNN
jgi:hypothetical protein